MIALLAPVQVADGINVGALVDRALAEIHEQHKTAWLTCGIDAAGWSRSLRGQQPLDLWKLRHLPPKFWRVFFELFAAALIREWWTNEEQPYRMAKADLKADAEQKRSA